MKKRMIILCCLTAVLLFGCGAGEITSVDIMRIPLVGNYWVEVPVPKDAQLTATDSYVTWTFKDGSSITKYAGADGVYTVETPNEAVYVNKKLNVSLVFSGNKQWTNYIKEHRNEVVIHEGAIRLEKDNRVGAWMSLDGLKYKETDSGVWMPGDFIYNTWLMPVYRDGLSYFSTSVKYWSEEEMQLACLGYLAANDSGEVLWSTERHGMIFRNDKVGVGYKKITENKYIWYISSKDMFDYVVLNVQKGE